MRSIAIGVVLSSLAVVIPSFARQAQQTATAPAPVQRDAAALATIQKAISAMGSTVPADSIATGTITIIAGSSTDQGAVRILTRGTVQTAEQIRTSHTQVTEVFSAGQASEVRTSGMTPLTGNRAASTQSRDFPLPLLSSWLANPDESLRYIGLEQSGTSTLAHIAAINSFSSQPGLQVLSEFTAVDVWIDAQTALPTKVAWTQRDGGGASPPFARQTLLSSYQSFGGVLYPTSVDTYINGTLWMQFAIQTVTFNNGLTDADFPVPAVLQ